MGTISRVRAVAFPRRATSARQVSPSYVWPNPRLEKRDLELRVSREGNAHRVPRLSRENDRRCTPRLERFFQSPLFSRSPRDRRARAPLVDGDASERRASHTRLSCALGLRAHRFQRTVAAPSDRAPALPRRGRRRLRAAHHRARRRGPRLAPRLDRLHGSRGRGAREGYIYIYISLAMRDVYIS